MRITGAYRLMTAIVYALAPVFAFSFAFVFMAEIVHEHGTIVSTIYTYGISAGLFLIFKGKDAINLIISTRKHSKSMPLIGSTTFFSTCLAYVVLQNTSAIFYVAVFFGSFSTITKMLGKLLGKNSPLNLFDIGVFVLAILTGIAVLPETDLTMFVWMTATLVASLSGAYYLFVSEPLHNLYGYSALDIAAIRFLPTIVICFGASWIMGINIQIPLESWITFFVVAVIGSILPLYLLQKSLEISGTIITSMFLPLIPPISLIAGHLREPNDLLGQHLFIVTPLSLGMVIAAFVKWKTTTSR